MSKIKNRVTLVKFISLVILTASLLFYYFYFNQASRPEIIVQDFEAKLISQSQINERSSIKYLEILSSTDSNYWPKFEQLDKQNDLLVNIYQNNELLYWNNSIVSIPPYLSQSSISVEPLGQSWFLINSAISGEFTVFLYSPIITDYNIDNQYIETIVNPVYSNFEGLRLHQKPSQASHSLNTFNNGAYFVSLTDTFRNNPYSKLVFLLILIWYSTFFSLLIELCEKRIHIIKKQNLRYLLAFIFVLLFRFLDIYLGISNLVFSSDLFQNQLFTIGLLSTLADFIIFFLLILILLIYTYKDLLLKSSLKEKSKRPLFQFLYLVTAVLLPFILLLLSSEVIINMGFTQLYFFVKNAEGLTLTFVFLLIGTIIYLWLRILVLKLNEIKFSWQLSALSLLFLLLLVFIIDSFYIKLYLLSLLFSAIVVLSEWEISKRHKFYILHHLLYIIAIATLFSTVINKSVDSNKGTKQLIVSEFLSRKGDKSIEQFWTNYESRIKGLSGQNRSFDSNSYSEDEFHFKLDSIIQSINPNFSYQITICETHDSLDITEIDEIVNCKEFFESLKQSNINSIHNNLYLINNEPDNIYYLGELELGQDIRAYVELFSFYVPSGLGYAELLLDKDTEVPDLSSFSFSKYREGILISKLGSYEYHTTSRNFDKYENETNFRLNNYKHYKSITSDNEILIVSRREERLSSKMISFSSLVILFALIFMLLNFIIYGNRFKNLFNLNFRARLQLFFMIALSTILVSTALIIMYYAEKSSTLKLEAELNEKAHSVLIELQHKLSDHSNLDNVDRGELGALLQKFSLVFFSDINLYDTDGKIVASSRPQIFEQGLLSEMVNPRAYEEIFVDDLLYYNCTEKIGDLEYYSSYLPLMLTASEAAGIINLPYFARHKEQRRSFRFLLFTFVNLFVILGILGTIIAIFYSRLLTKPLSELQKNMANIRIDMHNAKVEWQSEDEIGELIDEYNKLVDKLEASAEILKRSERELAWREVARQIAHEIKNPLTPMKLNIQYLEKAYHENDKDFSIKIKDISKTLIQQIETLDKVAETFSDMAKTNIKMFVELDLLEVIKTTSEFYTNSHKVDFAIINPQEFKALYTNGILKDVTQIFNNLIKNSVEAIGTQTNGKIIVEISQTDSYHNVLISDNGNGISEDMREMIFTPYFTTRSKGTGLGLAIVKTLITDMGGDIKLDSTSNEGTTFVLKFLKSK